MSNIFGLIFIIVGLAFDLFGCLGLVRLPDVYNRLQAATKCVTMGTCSILFGSFLIVRIYRCRDEGLVVYRVPDADCPRRGRMPSPGERIGLGSHSVRGVWLIAMLKIEREKFKQEKQKKCKQWNMIRDNDAITEA